MFLLKRWKRIGEKIGLRRRQQISFGLDWGTHSAKFVGLKRVGTRLELTHCLLLDLPDYASSRQIEPIIQNRLAKIRLHGGKLTISLPLHGRILFGQTETGRVRGLRSLLRRMLTRKVPPGANGAAGAEIRLEERAVRQKWLPRASVRPQDNRLALEGQFLGMLLPANPARAAGVLNIGKSHTTLHVFSGGETLFFTALDFSTDGLIAAIAGNDTELSRKVAAYLRSAKLTGNGGRLRWTEAHGFVDLMPVLQNELKSFAKTVRQTLAKAGVQPETFYLAGGGALFTWMPVFLRQALRVPVKPLRPLSALLQNEGSDRLRQIEPVFAEAVSLALAGMLEEKDPSREIARSLRWLQPVARKSAQKFRLAALAFAFAVLLGHLAVTGRFDHVFQETQKNRLLLSDLQTEAASLSNLVRFADLRGKKLRLPQQGQNLSAVLQVIGETVSPGTWLTSLEVVPARKVKELRFRRGRKKDRDQAIVLHGKAVSGNYVNDFYNRLYQSGYFQQILLKRDDSVTDLSGTISYIILARIRRNP